MSDLIDRQAAIDALNSEKVAMTAYKDGVNHGNPFQHYNQGLTDGISALMKLPTAQLAQDLHSACADIISRQAAIDALGAEPLAISEYEEGLHTMWTDAKESIEALPSAQAEIIRCKDCKHRPIATRADEGVLWGFSVEFPDEICPLQCEDGWYNYYPKDDFYCANAERRTDG